MLFKVILSKKLTKQCLFYFISLNKASFLLVFGTLSANELRVELTIERVKIEGRIEGKIKGKIKGWIKGWIKSKIKGIRLGIQLGIWLGIVAVTCYTSGLGKGHKG